MYRHFLGRQRQSLAFVGRYIAANEKTRRARDLTGRAERTSIPANQGIAQAEDKIEFCRGENIASNRTRGIPTECSYFPLQNGIRIMFRRNSKRPILLELLHHAPRHQGLNPRNKGSVPEGGDRNRMNRPQVCGRGRSQMVARAPAKKKCEQKGSGALFH
jgi:hypothetical protein